MSNKGFAWDFRSFARTNGINVCSVTSDLRFHEIRKKDCMSWKVTSIDHVLSLGVTPLFCEDDPDVRATGFWFIAKEQVYLITANHVLAQHPGTSWTARMHVRDATGVSMTKQTSFCFKVPGRILCCPNADLAAVPIDDGVDLDSAVFSSFNSSNVAQPGDHFWNQMMDVGTEVRMPGYPGGAIDQYNRVPVIRFGRLAQDPKMDWFGEQSSVVNMNVYPSDSGAPIIWMGQVEERNLVKSKETNELQMRIAVRDDVKLLGIHTGDFTAARKGDVALGVFAKAQVLSDDCFATWIPMEEESVCILKHSEQSSNRPRIAEPTDLERQIAETLGDGELNLVETLSGRSWRFHFDEKKILVRITNSNNTFNRVAPWKFGGNDEAKLPTFASYNEDHSSADCIFLSHCFSPDSRRGGIVLSAYECFEMPPKGKVPFSPDVVSWILKQ